MPRPKLRELDEVDQRVAEKMYLDGTGLLRISHLLACSYWEVREVLLKRGVKLARS